jgi:hypothetical protein
VEEGILVEVGVERMGVVGEEMRPQWV